MVHVTDEMIYAFAGEPEITATDAHAIEVGLRAVFAIVESKIKLAASLNAEERSDLLLFEAQADSFLSGRKRGDRTALIAAFMVDHVLEVLGE
jgi:hypothetical protein